MNIRDCAAEFSVYVLSDDADLGAGIKLALSQANYDTYFFADANELFDRMQINPPHVVVIDHDAVDGRLSDYLEKLLNISAEKIICNQWSDLKITMFNCFMTAL